jgi:hypothetical protein
LENLAFTELDLKVRTSIFDLNNDEFTRKIGNAEVSSKEGTSKMRNGDGDGERPHLQEAIINGNTITITYF